MVLFRNILLVMAALFALTPTQVNAVGYNISIDTSPQTVDIRGTMSVTLRISKNSNPVPNTQVFLGLQGITGELKSQMVITDRTGTATTEFMPKDPGTGYILAKATINDSGKIESLEAMAQISVKDLNAEPAAIVDQIYPLPGRVGQAIVFVGHGIDSDGKVTSWSWNMGDGKTYDGIGENSRISHIFENTGTYTVNFTVTDDRNSISKPVSSRITVIDNKLPVGSTVGSWPTKGNINQELSFEARLHDPEGRLAGCRIDFGDGNSQQMEAKGAEYVCLFRHKYARPGTYGVFAIPSDDQGNGDTFPVPAWQVVIEGEAKGGVSLIIKGGIGKTVSLLGPLPSSQIAFEATLGTETIETGLILSEGQYRLVASDRSFGFDMQSSLISVIPYASIKVPTSVWIPSVRAETATSHGSRRLSISLVDQSGQPIIRNAVITVTTDERSVTGVIQTSTGQAWLPVGKNVSTLNTRITADFDFVSVSVQKNLQFPPSLPDIRLKPVSATENPEILITSNILVTGQMRLNWKLWDRIRQTEIPVNTVIASAPEEIYISLIPYRLPVRIAKTDPGRYLLTVDCQMNVFGTKVEDSCQFDPCAQKIDIMPAWGISPGGKIVLRAQVQDQAGKPVAGQKMLVSFELGRAIGWVPDRSILSSLPKSTRTNGSGKAWLEVDLAAALKDVVIEDVKVTFSTVSSGITHFHTISVPPPPKVHPVLEAQMIPNGQTLEVRLRLLDKDRNPLAGKWIDICYSVGVTGDSEKYLGQLPVSIRTNHEGFATFSLPKPDKSILEILFHADIDGMSVTNILKSSRQ